MRGMAYINNTDLRDSIEDSFMSMLSQDATWQRCCDDWEKLRVSYCRVSHYDNRICELFSKTLNDIVLTKYNKLTEWYIAYVNWADKPEGIDDQLRKIFSYTHFSNIIAEFFIQNEERLQVSTCHYCEMAYVNVYRTKDKRRRQFDVEHVLDKGSCPFVSLSLYNLTLSCQYCNSRLKGTKVIGDEHKPIVKLSPTSDLFEFDKDVHIRIYPDKLFNYQNILDSEKKTFRLYFKTDDNDYPKYTKLFHLEERYNAHIVEGLRLIQMYHKYPRNYQYGLRSLGIAVPPQYFGNISEDVIGNEFVYKHHRIFEKLHRDVTEQCTQRFR